MQYHEANDRMRPTTSPRDMAQAVLTQTSPNEMKHLHKGDLRAVTWLVERLYSVTNPNHQAVVAMFMRDVLIEAVDSGAGFTLENGIHVAAETITTGGLNLCT